MVAWHNDPALKAATVAEMEAHREADRLVKGLYWDDGDGKGCAVGCLIKSGNHSLYETRFGIPRMLARLEDCLFEGLPTAASQEWPVRFLSAIRPGAELSLVGWKLLHWLIDEEVGKRRHLTDQTRAACAGVAAAIEPKTRGEACDPIALRESRAAYDAYAAAAYAAAAYAAAAYAAAAYAAAAAADAYDDDDDDAAYDAAAAAAAAAVAAKRQCCQRIADKLIELLQAA